MTVTRRDTVPALSLPRHNVCYRNSGLIDGIRK
jgi:hypothetical protein